MSLNERDWDDLGDDELASRLQQRGVDDILVNIMVAERDCCDGCRQRISNALNE